LLIEMIGDD